jgi:hypothetical protein
MKITTTFTSLLAVALNVSMTSAADCHNYGTGSSGIGACAHRSDNYKDRETFCGSLAGQGSWNRKCQNGSHKDHCHFEYQGPSMPQQMCWDAFENIIKQCFNHQNGGGYHSGSWSLDGHYFYIDRCSA